MNTPAKILEYLENHSPATISQISRALDLTRADIRHHMKSLIQNQMVEILPEIYRSGPGRPSALFQPTQHHNAALMENLITSLIGGIAKYQLSPEDRLHLSERVAAGLLSGLEVSGSPAIRLTQITNHLQSLGFSIRWEAHAEGPALLIQQEPLSSLIHDPEFTSLVIACLLRLIHKMVSGLPDSR